MRVHALFGCGCAALEFGGKRLLDGLPIHHDARSGAVVGSSNAYQRPRWSRSALPPGWRSSGESEHFTHLAAYRLQAHGELVDQAGGPLQCLQLEVPGVGSGHGRLSQPKGKQEYLAYKASTSLQRLEKYRNAAARPWLVSRPTRQPPPQWRTPELMLMELRSSGSRSWTNSFRAAASNGETAVDCVVCWRGSACSTGRLDWPSDTAGESLGPAALLFHAAVA